MSLVATIPAPLTPSNRPQATPSAGETPSTGVAPRISEALPIWPVAAPASAEAVVKEHIAEQVAKAEYEQPQESEGIELDHIPYTGDEAILIDDLPKALPAEPKAKVDSHAPAAELVASQKMQVGDETETVVSTDPAKSEFAMRAYLAEREIAGVRPQQQQNSDEPTETKPANAESPQHSGAITPSKPNVMSLQKQI